jgi:hypothetical protein
LLRGSEECEPPLDDGGVTVVLPVEVPVALLVLLEAGGATVTTSVLLVAAPHFTPVGVLAGSSHR